jgi:very-short-patch-repair endonuclease
MPPQALAALAERQMGVVAHSQMLELGLSKSAIHRMVQAGRLHRLYRGVYAVGHRAVSAEGRLMAAVLACGRGAVLSHRSAAARWSMVAVPSVIDVTVERGRGGGHRGIEIHRVRHFDRRDWMVMDGLRLTTPARTLLDLAEVVPPRQLRRAAQEAARMRRFNERAIRELLDRSPGRRGHRQLRALLRDAVIEPRSRTYLEDRFLELVKEAGVEKPQINAKLLGYTVDALWEAQKVVVELDGFQDHGTRARFETDRERDATLQLAGYTVLRFTDRMLEREHERVRATLRASLARRSPPPARGTLASAPP